MCVALPLLPQYVFVAWCSVKNTEITLPLPLHIYVVTIVQFKPHEYTLHVLKSIMHILMQCI